MAFTYNLATDRGKVRLIIDDKDTVTVANQFFDDDEIDCFLTLAGDLDSEPIRTASAMALETWASNQVMVLKLVQLLDVQVDGVSVSREMRQRSAILRKEAEEIGAITSTDAGFEIAEMALGHFSWVEQVENEAIEDVD